MTQTVSSHPLIECRSTLDWRGLTGLIIVEPDPGSSMPTAAITGMRWVRELPVTNPTHIRFRLITNIIVDLLT
jgi:hypothetical protein